VKLEQQQCCAIVRPFLKFFLAALSNLILTVYLML